MVGFKGLIQLNESFSEDEKARVVASGRIMDKDLDMEHRGRREVQWRSASPCEE